MSVQFMESFGAYPDGDHTPADGAFGNKWSQNNTWVIEDLGGGRKRVYEDDYHSYPYLKATLPAVLGTLVFGARVHEVGGSHSEEPMVRFFDGGDEMLEVIITSAGHLEVKRGGTVILTSTNPLATNADTHITLKIVFDNSAGSVELYLNGTLDDSVSGVDTIDSGSQCDNFGLHSDTTNYRWSDIYVDDSDVHGDAKVVYEPADTAGSESDWTPSAGANHECVDEVGPDDDTTYNRSTANGDRDSLEHGAGTAFGEVLAVEAFIRARKEDANNGEVKIGVKHSGSEDQSAGKGLGEDYSYLWEIFETCPSTGSAWLASQLPDTELTYENVST